MNEETTKVIMRKVILADQLIFRQQLGLDWSPPEQDLFRNVDPLIFSRAVSLEHAETAFEMGMQVKIVKGKMEQKTSLASEFNNLKKSRCIARILDLLCKEAAFLVSNWLI